MADASPGGLPADPRDAPIREQAERLGEQERRLAAQAEQIVAQVERIAALEAMVADLRDRLAAAERARSRNSGNSSMTPSVDGLPGRKPPAKQRRPTDRAEKKQGKRPGSPGIHVVAGPGPDRGPLPGGQLPVRP